MRILIQVIAIVVAIVAAPASSSYSISLAVHKQLTLTDAPKPLYTTVVLLNSANNMPYADVYPQQTMALDLDAPFTWHYAFPRQESCQGCAKAVTCAETPCTALRTAYSYQSPSCHPPSNFSMFEGFNDCELCPINVINPVTGACSQAVFAAYDEITLSSHEVPTSSYTTYPVTGLAGPDEFRLFPMGVRGVLALSSSAYAVSATLNENVNRIVALCLPSSRPPQGGGTPHDDYYGLLTFGDGPYSLNVDIRSFLSYTALQKNSSSFGYFIGVNDIVIKNRSISVPANTTAKISTIEPYTKLRTDIYNNVLRRISKVTKRIPQAKTVSPFGLCYNTMVNGTNVGIKVANIDLVLPGGTKWTISTANSITQVGDGVACLALVDGGATAEHAIVIGTYQLEDNFVVFDMEKSRFGFYSLLRRGSACIDFQV